jgi:hypothetical protein
MNRLSLLIYVADVGERIGPAIWLVCLLVVASSIGIFLIANSDKDQDELVAVPIWPSVSLVALSIAVALLPSMKAALPALARQELGQPVRPANPQRQARVLENDPEVRTIFVKSGIPRRIRPGHDPRASVWP